MARLSAASPSTSAKQRLCIQNCEQTTPNRHSSTNIHETKPANLLQTQTKKQNVYCRALPDKKTPCVSTHTHSYRIECVHLLTGHWTVPLWGSPSDSVDIAQRREEFSDRQTLNALLKRLLLCIRCDAGGTQSEHAGSPAIELLVESTRDRLPVPRWATNCLVTVAPHGGGKKSRRPFFRVPRTTRRWNLRLDRTLKRDVVPENVSRLFLLRKGLDEIRELRNLGFHVLELRGLPHDTNAGTQWVLEYAGGET